MVFFFRTVRCASLLILGGILFESGLSLGQQGTPAPPYETFTIRGRIVWLNEVLSRQFGIQIVPEAAQQVLALQTEDGTLYPIADDIRGRALRRDERLRTLERCELLVRRYRGSPVVQIIRMFEWQGGRRYELDYYCDICAIVMFENRPCDCCQGPVELRRREIKESSHDPLEPSRQ